MNPQVNQQRMNVDLSNAIDIVCEQCGSRLFREVAFMKKVSALVSPTGKDAMVPVGTFACAACNHVNAEFDPFRPQVAKGE
jgi:DNA-directed RNA polymerase subunit RPC12/RpoP